MAETSEGWDGTVNEATIARLLNALGAGVVSDPGAFAGAAVAGQRRVILSAGESSQSFIRYETDTPPQLDIPTPAAGTGQWFLIVQRRDWFENNVTHVVLPGDAAPTDGAATAGPLGYAGVTYRGRPSIPDGFVDQAGVSQDLPLLWVWANSFNTTLYLRDARQFASATDTIPVNPSRLLAQSSAAQSTLSGSIGELTIGTGGFFNISLAGPRASEFFTIANGVITVRKECRVRVKTTVAGKGGAIGGSSILMVLLNSVPLIDRGKAIAEDEVMLQNGVTQWHKIDTDYPCRVGDTLRIAYQNRASNGPVSWGDTADRPRSSVEVSVIGPYERSI